MPYRSPTLIAVCDVCHAKSEPICLNKKSGSPVLGFPDETTWDSSRAMEHLAKEGWRTIVGNELMCPECAEQFEKWRADRAPRTEE